MKRKEETNLRKSLEAERVNDSKASQWVRVVKTGQRIVSDASNTNIGQIKLGRRSFGNFNPAVERLELETEKLNESLEESTPTVVENTVSDLEMAQSLGKKSKSLTSTNKNPFKKPKPF